MFNCKELKIGITGHRRLGDPAGVAKVLRDVLAAVDGPPLRLFSALAEGTDRLAAHAVLEAGGSLHAVLPLPVDDYRTDFADAASQADFDALLARADRVEIGVSHPDRGAAYLFAGRRVVELCDILIAVWDGRPARGRGGTAEIVAHARSTGRSLYWIDSEDPSRIVRERMPEDIR